MQYNDQSKQPHNQQIPLNQVKKRSWYRTWWGVLIIIFVLTPILFITLIVAYALNSPHQQNYNEQNTPEKHQAQQEKEDELAQEKRQTVIDTYSQPYCNNHTNVLMKNDPVLTEDKWPSFDGRRNWTLAECRTIIAKLYDSGTLEERIVSLSEGRKIGVGMRGIEVIYSLGYPNDINTTTTSGNTNEQWVYGDPIYGATYVYLDNWVVTSYQEN